MGQPHKQVLSNNGKNYENPVTRLKVMRGRISIQMKCTISFVGSRLKRHFAAVQAQ